MKESISKQCAKCGSCAPVCPVFRITGRETHTARGKLHLLSSAMAGEPSAHFQDLFARCLLCGACEQVCSRELPIRQQVVEARGGFSRFYGEHPLRRSLVREVLARPRLLQGLVKTGLNLARLSQLPEESGLRIRLALLEDGAECHQPDATAQNQEEAGQEKEGIAYFSGCLARYLQPSIARGTSGLTGALTGKALTEPEKQVCCGLAAWSAGRMEQARELARKNIEVFETIPGPILTSCASCSSHLYTYPNLFADDPEWLERASRFSGRVQELTAFLEAALREKKMAAPDDVSVYYHEPCHLRFSHQGSGFAAKLLARIDRVSIAEGEECCGQGGLFHLGYPELSGEIFARSCEKLRQSGAEVLVTSCSGCLLQWQAGLASRRSRVRVMHLADWLASDIRLNP